MNEERKESRKMVKGWEMTTGANTKQEQEQVAPRGWDRTWR